jgi:pimeloyl-ACP methyl ester carboxylesterase
MTVSSSGTPQSDTPQSRRRAAPAWLLAEGLGTLELGRLVLHWPRLLTRPRGQGRRVLVFPGFGAGDESTLVLRSYLNALGYRAAGWGLGRNDGNVPTLLAAARSRVVRESERAGEPVLLVGWSLGGYLAREVARERPQQVARVITLGSPVVGGPKYTALASWFAGGADELDRIEAAVAARYRVPLRVPVTAIYSRRDRIVAWQACIDYHSPRVEHVEVDTTHIGLGFAPEVYELVADRLPRSGTSVA